jgi:hypothetical protein
MLDARGTGETINAAADGGPIGAQAGLRYVSDADPGWRRAGENGTLQYLNAAGHPIRNQAHLMRITSLAARLRIGNFDNAVCKIFLPTPVPHWGPLRSISSSSMAEQIRLLARNVPCLLVGKGPEHKRKKSCNCY